MHCTICKKKIPIKKTTLHNTLDDIKRHLSDQLQVSDKYKAPDFMRPSPALVAQVRDDFKEKKRLQSYTSTGSGGSSAGQKRSREEEEGARSP